MIGTFESSISNFSVKGLVPGGFKVGFIGSTCTTLPHGPATPDPSNPAIGAQVAEFEGKVGKQFIISFVSSAETCSGVNLGSTWGLTCAAPPSSACDQGPALVQFSAQLERFIWDRGCV